MSRISAGILIYRINNGQPEVYLVHPGGPFFTKKDMGHWSIPKGEIDDNEDYLACAIREVEEEVGLKLTGDEFIPLGSVVQKGGKTVHGWAYMFDGDFTLDNSKCMFELEWPPKSGKMKKFPEVDRGQFFDIPAANLKIKEAQKEFINRLQEFLNK